LWAFLAIVVITEMVFKINVIQLCVYVCMVGEKRNKYGDIIED